MKKHTKKKIDDFCACTGHDCHAERGNENHYFEIPAKEMERRIKMLEVLNNEPETDECPMREIRTYFDEDGKMLDRVDVNKKN